MGSAEKNGRISGRYTTRLNGLAFTYDATWREAGDGVIWTATLKRDEQFMGIATGQIRHTVAVRLADEVRRMVENAMEARAHQK